MTAADFRAIRALYGETQYAFGLRLGFEGQQRTVERKVRRYENDETPIVGPLAALLDLLRSAPVRRRLLP